MREYQEQAARAVFARWTHDRAALLVMATGTGKTVVFATIARQWCEDEGNEGRVLVLAHRRELVMQATAKMSACGCDMGRIDATTVQGMGRRLSAYPSDAYGLIIIDEAHHAAAKGYRRILDHFGSADVLGVTATPERQDGNSIADVFGQPCYSYGIADGIREGYLSPVTVVPTDIRPDLSAAHVVSGDYAAGDVADAIEPWLDAAAEWIHDNAADRKTVVFLPLVKTARKMVDACERAGLTAAEVDGDSPDREQVLADFSAGKYQVLCNAMLLTEGWDCPEVSCVMVLRPTKSRALYCQMVGRGTRTAEGKVDCLVPDVLAYGKDELVRPWDVLSVAKPAEEREPARQARQRGARPADREASTAHQLNERSRGTTRRAGREQGRRHVTVGPVATALLGFWGFDF